MRAIYTLSLGLLIGLGVSLGLGTTGCGQSDNEVKACDSCPGQFAYLCQVPSSNNIVCAIDDAQASGLCPEGWSGKVNCAAGSGGQQAWEPELLIQLDRTSGLYQVDRELLDALAVDGWVLMAQDSARLSEQVDGYFQLDGVAPDDLAALLGLQDGDVPLEVNGFPLKSWDGYATAVTQLTSETIFVVSIARDGKILELRYEVL